MFSWRICEKIAIEKKNKNKLNNLYEWPRLSKNTIFQKRIRHLTITILLFIIWIGCLKLA